MPDVHEDLEFLNSVLVAGVSRHRSHKMESFGILCIPSLMDKNNVLIQCVEYTKLKLFVSRKKKAHTPNHSSSRSPTPHPAGSDTFGRGQPTFYILCIPETERETQMDFHQTKVHSIYFLKKKFCWSLSLSSFYSISCV